MTIYHVYRIVSDDNQHEFVGATSQALSVCMAEHRRKAPSGSSTLYCRMREIGIHKFSIVFVESRECANTLERNKFKREVYDRIQPNLNAYKPHPTEQEKHQQYLHYSRKQKAKEWEERNIRNKAIQDADYAEILKRENITKEQYHDAVFGPDCKSDKSREIVDKVRFIKNESLRARQDAKKAEKPQ